MIKRTASPADFVVSDLLGSLSESAPQAIDSLAKRYRAEGRPVIAFGAGEPDFDTPGHIVEAVAAALREPVNHHYSPPAGLPALREAIADRVSDISGIRVGSTEVAVANGGKQAIYNALSAVLNPGDEVLLPVPYWTSYPEQIRLAGGSVVPVEASVEEGHKVSVEGLEAARTARTRLLIVNSPSNPTGAVYSERELRAIGEWAADAGIWVLSDEIYHHFVYDDAAFSSIAPFMPREQLLIVGGLAKSHVLTGWRLGWTVGPEPIIAAISSFQSHTTGNVSNLSQRAALAALAGGNQFPEMMRDVFARRRTIALRTLSEVPRVRVMPPKGAFYVFADVRDALDGSLEHDGRGVDTSLALSAMLLDCIDVAVVPGEAFGAPGFLRFSYALDDDQLTEGLGRIRALFEKRFGAPAQAAAQTDRTTTGGSDD